MNISVFYSNVRDAANESGLPLDEVLNKIKAVGISALDFDYADIKNGLPSEAVKAGFKANSIYAFFDFSEDDATDEAREAVDLSAELGAKAMFVPRILPKEEISGLKAERDFLSICGWLNGNSTAIKTAAALEKLAIYGEEKHTSVCVENFDSHRSLTERKAELNWLFDKAPHLNFNLDTGNSATCEEDVTELYTLFRNRIVNVHCKDRIENLRTTAVGTGIIPIIDIRNSLHKTGYVGGFSVEVFGVKDMLNAIITSAQNLISK